MSSIDRRVVEARFDNAQFQSGVKNTMDSLSGLQKGLKMDGATKGLQNVSDAANRTKFDGMKEGLKTLVDKFDTLRVVGLAVLSSIAIKAVQTAQQVISSFTTKPITDGLEEYETNLNSIQTILSNTQWENKTLTDVEGALSNLNEYADLTIYNFAEMARNIGTFTAAGVGLDTSVDAIKGIANLAAISGSNSQQASTAMYQLSQAVSSGTVRLMDWNSVQNAGMGGKAFQDAILRVARNHGVGVDDMIEKNGSFRESLQEGWLSSEILLDTLSQFTGEVTAEQLKAQGYTEDQIETILKMGETAIDAATDIKTITQLMDTLGEAVGTGWADTWAILFGDFEEAKELWGGVYDVVGGFVDANADARNKVLGDWKELGGRTALIEGIGLAFNDVLSFIKPVKNAFRDIFPPVTAERLYELTTQFRDFFKEFRIGADTANNIRRIFRGLFAALDIGRMVLGEVLSFFGRLFQKLFEGSGVFLDMGGNLGDMIVRFRDAIKRGEGLSDFFDGLYDKLANVIDRVKVFVRNFASMFDNIDFPDFSVVADGLEDVYVWALSLSDVWEGVIDVLGRVWSSLGDIASRAFNWTTELTGAVRDMFSDLDIDWEDVLATFNTGLLAGLLVTFRSAFGGGGGGGGFGDIIESITGPFEALTGTLSTMQNTLRATTLLQIAAAVGILALSTVSLSKVDKEGLAQALGALTAMFIQLFAAMAGFQAIGGAKGLATTSGGLILFATALLVLTVAVKRLAVLEWEELAKGLTGVAALLILLVGAAKGLSTQSGGMVSAGVGLLIISAALKVLVSVMEDFNELSWEEIGKGLAGIGALLASLALFTRLAALDKGGASTGVGLLLLAAGIKILASAAQDFSAMSWEEIGKGLAAIGGILAGFAIFSQVMQSSGIVRAGASLLIISAAMHVFAGAMKKFSAFSWEEIARGLVAMGGALLAVTLALNFLPPSTLASAVALTIVAGALLLVAEAMEDFGGMSWEEIAKGLVTLAGSLIIIAGGLYLMTGTLAGSAALLIAAGALRTLTPVLQALGDMSLAEIGLALLALAGAFTVLGLAGLILAPVIPALLGLSIAVAALGVGLALIGAGVLLFATGLTTIAAAGAAASAVVIGFIRGMITLLPLFALNLANSLVLFTKVILQAAPTLLAAATQVFNQFLLAAQRTIPNVMRTVRVFVTQLLETVKTLVPKFADTGLAILQGFLKSLEKRIPSIVNSVVNLVIRMLNVLTDRTPEFAEAAADFIVAMINGVTNNINKIVTAAGNLVVEFINGMSNNVNKIVRAGGDLIVELINGISDNLQRIIRAGGNLIIAFVRGLGEEGLRITNAAAQTLIKFINGLTRAIYRYSGRIRSAARRLAFAIIDGITGGLASKVGNVANSIKNMASSAVNTAKGWLGIRSPSKVFYEIGEFTGEGLALGISSMQSRVEQVSRDAGEGAVESMRKSLTGLHDIVDADLNLQPTVKPVIDLTEVRKGAAEIENTFGRQPLSVAQTEKNVSRASAGYSKRVSAQERVQADNQAAINLNYTQNNTSPKALTSAEIYRQTRNHLSAAKGALTPNVLKPD